MDDWPIRIIVLDRGFVFVCRCPDPLEYALWLPYRDRRTVRRWGTTEGLGQLCDGPLGSTVLDAVVPEGNVPVRAVLDVMELTPEGRRKWEIIFTAGRGTSTGRPRTSR